MKNNKNSNPIAFAIGGLAVIMSSFLVAGTMYTIVCLFRMVWDLISKL